MALRGVSAPVELIASPRLVSAFERRPCSTPQTPLVQASAARVMPVARVMRVLPATEAQSSNERRDADEQLWWSERVRKITASIDQKLDRVVGANSTPVLQPRVLEVEVNVQPARDGPPAGETVRAAAFDHQESSNELRSCSPGRSVADDEIPSALATLKSMRHEIEVLRERQNCEARSVQEVGAGSPLRGHAPSLPAPPLQSSSSSSRSRRVFPEVDRADSVGVSEVNGALGSSAEVPPAEVCPSISLRQEQQELRITALQAKLRHLEQHLGGEVPRQLPAQDSSWAAPPSSRQLDKLLEAELGSLKQELRAQHMEHAVGMVQEANVLRKDVSVALRNEREARCEEVAELRSTLESVQDRLMREFHETMDLIGSRLEQHLQAAVDPDRIDEIVTKRMEMVRILSRASDIQQGAVSGAETTDKEIDIEREARCRSIIDLRIEMEGKLVEGVERVEEQCASLTADLSALQETVAALANNSQAVHAVSFGDHVGGSTNADVHVLAEQLEVERLTRASEMKDLSDRISVISSDSLGQVASESLAMAVVDNLKLVERQMQDIEKERSLWHDTADEVKDLRTIIASELDQIRESIDKRYADTSIDANRLAVPNGISGSGILATEARGRRPSVNKEEKVVPLDLRPAVVSQQATEDRHMQAQQTLQQPQVLCWRDRPFAVGDQVKVLANMRSHCQEQYHLPVGTVGRILKFDEDGDCMINFDDVPKFTWISADQMHKLTKQAFNGETAEASAVVESLRLVEKQMSDFERERSVWHDIATEVKELKARMGSELERIEKYHNDARADPSREGRVSEHVDGEIATLYGMVKEALGDTVRLSVEIDTERKTRYRELEEMRKLVGAL